MPAGTALDHYAARLGGGRTYLLHLAAVLVLALPMGGIIALTGGLLEFDAGGVSLAGPAPLSQGFAAGAMLVPAGFLFGTVYFVAAGLVRDSFPTRLHWKVARAERSMRKAAARRAGGDAQIEA